ncbi:MAG: matrixin family metalloprotease, partial [Halobacteriota archaeon]
MDAHPALPAVLLVAVVVAAGFAMPALPESPDLPVGPLGSDDGPGSFGSSGALPFQVGESNASPWGDDPIVVAVNGSTAPDQEFVPLVREATAYWNENASRYTGYEVDFVVRPDATEPDVVVTFVPEVPECNGMAEAAGCAPLVTSARGIERPEPVWVKTGLSDESTALVLTHEFGHVLGLSHDDPPTSVMGASSVLYTEPQPNATDRTFPWRDGEFTVFVEYSAADDPAAARRQVQYAFDYYEDDPPGMPTNLTFRPVEDPTDAE